MPLTDDQIAKYGYRQALVENPALPDDHYEDGLAAVTFGRNIMNGRSTWDTATNAVDMADMALIQYVRAFLLGRDPETDQQFRTAKDVWLKSAAIETHALLNDCYQDPEYDQYRKRVRDFSVRDDTCGT